MCFAGKSAHSSHQLLQESVISRRLRSKRKDSEGSVRGGTSLVGPREAEFNSGVSWAPLALQMLGGPGLLLCYQEGGWSSAGFSMNQGILLIGDLAQALGFTCHLIYLGCLAWQS